MNGGLYVKNKDGSGGLFLDIPILGDLLLFQDGKGRRDVVNWMIVDCDGQALFLAFSLTRLDGPLRCQSELSCISAIIFSVLLSPPFLK